MKAIVYTSNTGYTKEYAELLKEELGLPVFSLRDSFTQLDRDCEILYLGWLMAGTVKGYRKAAKRYRIMAVCGVGMGASGSQDEDIRKTNHIPEEIPVFSLQGGFDLKRLKGIYKLMMTVMAKTAGKGLADKKERTPDEDVLLDMMLHGGNYVKKENLAELLAWVRRVQEKI